MTSIHAAIPISLQAAVDTAKRRGEDATPTFVKLPSRKRPLMALQLPTPAPLQSINPESDLSDDEGSASKENDPALSPSPVNYPAPSPRRPLLNKRPLSDLPTPTEIPSDDEDEARSGLTSSERNIAANTPHLSSSIASMVVSEHSPPSPKLVERSQSFNFAFRGKDNGSSGLLILPFEDETSGPNGPDCDEDINQPPKKRACSGEGKENVTEILPAQPVIMAKHVSTPGIGFKVQSGVELRKVSGISGASGGGSVRTARPRVGLRRL